MSNPSLSMQRYQYGARSDDALVSPGLPSHKIVAAPSAALANMRWLASVRVEL
jgi:hypothetical protein